MANISAPIELLNTIDYARIGEEVLEAFRAEVGDWKPQIFGVSIVLLILLIFVVFVELITLFNMACNRMCLCKKHVSEDNLNYAIEEFYQSKRNKSGYKLLVFP